MGDSSREGCDVCRIVRVLIHSSASRRTAPRCSTPSRWPVSRGTRLTGLRCHSDAGSQFTSVRYGERLAELGAIPSIGTVGDSYDNALAESVNGYYKYELIRPNASWSMAQHRRRGTGDTVVGPMLAGVCSYVQGDSIASIRRAGETL